MEPSRTSPRTGFAREALSRLALAPLLGRDPVLSALRHHIEDTERGRGRGLLLVGEPGIGKTRCANEVVGAAEALGVRVHRTRCHERVGAPALWPWVQIARSLCAERDDASLRRLVEPDLVALTALLPAETKRLGLSPAVAGAAESEDRFRLFEAATSLLRRAAAESPLLLVIDDLHWADPASVVLARFVLRETRDAPIALLCLYRDTDLQPGHPLAESLADLGSDSEVYRLAGLGEEDVARFMHHVAGFEVQDVLAAAVHAQTGGNPLFVTEIVRMLASEGRLEEIDASAPTSAPLPATVRHTLKRRFAALQPETRRVLQHAAVIGAEFDREILEHCCSVGRDELASAIDEGCETRVIHPAAGDVARFRFAHDLMREAIYDLLGEAERSRIHGSVAEAIVALRSHDLSGRFAELAHHFLLASSPGSARSAAGFAARAARDAARVYSFEEATRLYEQALRALDLARIHPGDTPELEALHCRVRVELGEVLWQRGERQRAREQNEIAVRSARELGDATLLARAAIGLAGVNDVTMDFPQPAARTLAEALDALPREDSTVRVRVLANLVRARYFGEERKQIDLWAQEAVARAERIGDPGTLFTALEAQHYALLVPERLEQRVQISAQLPHLARRSGSARCEALAHLWRVVDLLEVPDVAGVDAALERLDQLASEIRHPLFRWLVACFRATRSQMEGRLADAELDVDEALRLGREADTPNALIAFGTQLFHLRAEQGRVDELLPLMGRITADSPALPVFGIGVPLIHALCGRRDEARATFERVAAADFADVPRDLHRIPMLTSAATLCLYLGDRRRAALLREELARLEGRVVLAGIATHWSGSIDRYLGHLEETLGLLPAAVSHYERAAKLAETAGAHLLHAHTLCDLARVLRSRGEQGERSRADALEGQAARQYQALGVAWRLATLGGGSAAPDAAHSPHAKAAAESTAPSSNRIVERAGMWQIVFRGKSIELPATRGLADVARLLESPNREMHVLELAAADPGRRELCDPEAGLRITRGEDAPALLDEQAMQAYRQRLQDLAVERGEAERNRDTARLASLDEEAEFLEREFRAARGLSGRPRRTTNSVERARKAVYNRIRATLRRLRAEYPELALHLEHSLHTGTFCSYRPEQETRWLRE